MKIALLPLLALAFAFAGCDKTSSGANAAPNDAVLFQAIQDNANALEKKDVDAVMATIHPQSPSFEPTRALMNSDMFKAVELKYALSDLKVVSASPEEAEVSFHQKMIKTAGDAPFQDNIVEGVHTLRPDNGKWKIFATRNVKVTDVDGKPLGIPDAEAQPAAPAPKGEAPPKPAAPAEKPAP